MKISDNISRSSFLWQIRILRAISVLFLMFAYFNPKSLPHMVAFSGISFLASIIFFRRRAAFMLEVYDCGDCLKLKLGGDEASISLFDIEKVEIRDGKDGLDWIIIHLCVESKFGGVIEFYPNMVKIPMGRLDIWLKELNERIFVSRMARGR